jgi:predicted O-linked N-acetylglucosamine transferase (SPINDLY family)
LKRHSVAYFLQPLFEHHDREKFEITAYSNTDLADDVTEQLKRSCERWRDIVTMGDEQVAETILADEIDILIDLAGHTTGNRLAVFGRKPAPIQMTYLGYPNTTGLSSIDYRVTDELADPPGMTEAFHSEKLLRLPAPFLCYQPPGVAPDVVEPPMLRNGYVTFGSFNKAAKAGPETIALWSAVLRALPTSRLMMKSRGLASEGSRRRIIDAFASQGVSQDRLQLIEAEQPLAAHLAMYGQIDIALDTFPYHGTTTTCEAMWMGVPVVTRAGKTHVSRVGVSLLTAVGLSDLVAEADELFVAKAVAMTSKGAELTGLRAGLRDRMQASPLCDQGGFAKRFEVALRALWKAKVL